MQLGIFGPLFYKEVGEKNKKKRIDCNPLGGRGVQSVQGLGVSV